jgi:hypothetical protein
MKAVRRDRCPLLISCFVMLLSDERTFSADAFDTYHRVQAAGRRPHVRKELLMLGWDVNPFSFRFPSTAVLGKEPKEAVQELKDRLLKACRSTSKSDVAREVVESAIAALVPYSPVKETCTSPLLQRKWKLYVLANLHPTPQYLSSLVSVFFSPQLICHLSIEPFIWTLNVSNRKRLDYREGDQSLSQQWLGVRNYPNHTGNVTPKQHTIRTEPWFLCSRRILSHARCSRHPHGVRFRDGNLATGTDRTAYSSSDRPRMV